MLMLSCVCWVFLLPAIFFMKLNEINNVLTLKLVLSHQAEMLNSVQFKVNLKQPTVKQNNQGSLLFSTPCQME